METWKKIKNWEDYEVSNLGRVRSFKGKSVRILKQGAHSKGYLFVVLSRRNPAKTKSVTVHRLIMEAFVGQKPKGQIIRHLNDIKTDNRLENLAFGCMKLNAQDAKKNGHVYGGKIRGLDNPGAKLCEDKQKFINDFKDLLSGREIARQLEVHHRTIQSFLKKESYL